MRDVTQAAGLIADFALDDERSRIAVLLERIHKFADIDLSLAQGHFLSPLPGDGRAPGVLDVHGPDIGAEDLDGANRVAHVIEQHVRRIEVDLQVGQAQLVECQAEQVGGLLAGLESQRDAPGRGQLARLGQRLENRGPARVVRRRQETRVQRQVATSPAPSCGEWPI